MGSDWQDCALGDAITLKRGYDLPAKERRPGSVPIVSSSGISDVHSESMVKGPGVVTGRYGTIGQVFYVDSDFWPLNTTLYVQDFKGNDRRFVAYMLRTVDFHQFSDKAAVPGVNRNHLHTARILLPPVSEQVRVASVLQSFDDRIDLLRQTNATLESIAQALFKSWFVDFDPVRAKAEGREPEGMDAATAALFPAEFEESALGLIPKGWSAIPFAKTVNIMGGGTPKTSIAEYWGGNIPWFSVVDAPGPGQVFTLRTEKFVTTAGVDHSSTRVLPAWTTIISARGTVGKLAMTACPMAMNQSCYGLVPRFPGTEPLVYLAAQRLVDDLRRLAHGGVFDTITRDTLSSVNVVYAPPDVQTSFAAIVQPVFKQIQEGVARMRTLTELRDTLLPRLMSGKLRLPEAQTLLQDAIA